MNFPPFKRMVCSFSELNKVSAYIHWVFSKHKTQTLKNTVRSELELVLHKMIILKKLELSNMLTPNLYHRRFHYFCNYRLGE